LPGFTFVTSPLRPILERSSPAAMRPDAPLLVLDTRPAQWRTGAAFAVSLALLGVLAAYRGWLPTGRRRPRPLAQAARSLARSDPHASPQAYQAGLVTLHRALDARFARRLLADDLDLFLALHPRFAEASSDLRRFFAASRTLHFGDDVAEAMRQLPAGDLTRLARRLASIERAP
jgi:mxaA protein